MRAYDPLLSIIARAAKVKTCHVFHCFHAIAELRGNFHIDAFAEFAGLERKHVEAVIDAMKAHNAMPRPAKRETVTGTRLGADFIVPADWVQWAVVERGWQQQDAAQEALAFVDYWAGVSARNGVKSDWFATWRNWCRRSNRVGQAKIESTTDERTILERQLKVEEMMGHDYEADVIRKQLAKMSNVVPFKSVG